MTLRHVFLAAALTLGAAACGGDESAGPLPQPAYHLPPSLLSYPFYQSKWLNVKQGETVRIETPSESWSLRFFDHKGEPCIPVVCNLPEQITAAVEVNLGTYHSYGQVPMARSIEEGNHVVDFSSITVTTPTYTGRFRLRSLHPEAGGKLGATYSLSITSPVTFPDETLTIRLRGVDLESFCPCQSTCSLETAYSPVLDIDYLHRRYRWTPADGNPPVPYTITLKDEKIDACNVETLGFDSRFMLTVKKR